MICKFYLVIQRILYTLSSFVVKSLKTVDTTQSDEAPVVTPTEAEQITESESSSRPTISSSSENMSPELQAEYRYG